MRLKKDSKKTQRPENIKFILIDSLNKRIKIINDLCAKLGIKNVEAVHGRAEELARKKDMRESFDLCVSRAVANMSTLTEYCLPFVKQNGSFISMKSAESNEEIGEAKKAIGILGGKIEEDIVFDLVENMPRRIIKIKKNSQTPTKYPRPSAQIEKKPLK